MRVRRRLVAALYLTGLLLLSHGVAPAAGSDFARDAELDKRRAECGLTVALQGAPCTSSPVERENCVLRCTSEVCYDRLYGTDALEEGEIDNLRGRVYRACVRTEIRNEQLRAAQAQAQAQ